VDEPALSIEVGINTSPFAGREGKKLTARQVKARLDQELLGNVSIRVLPTDRPDAWEVQGRGELQLVVLLELMRREGFELTAGQPKVVTREEDGQVLEPAERLLIDVPEEHVGSVTQLLAGRKGRMESMTGQDGDRSRIEFIIPARGLIGFRTEFLTETRGTGIMHHVFSGWEPWAGEITTRATGSLVADRQGKAASFALFGLQERGTLFIEPGDEVFVLAATDLPATAGSAELGTESIHSPDEYRLRAIAVDESTAAGMDPAPVVVEWPASTGLDLATATDCARLSASAAGSVFADATQLTWFRQGDAVYQLAVAGVLPGDPAC
jgi:hypothetical protein